MPRIVQESAVCVDIFLHAQNARGRALKKLAHELSPESEARWPEKEVRRSLFSAHPFVPF